METFHNEQFRTSTSKNEIQEVLCILHFWRHLTSSTIQHDKNRIIKQYLMANILQITKELHSNMFFQHCKWGGLLRF